MILDIFASHASTRQARLQVELAQLQYLLPRLTRLWSHLERQAGGIGTRGPGAAAVQEALVVSLEAQGIGVHTGARVAALAGPGEVWVSAIVPMITAGSGIEFEDRGTFELKGVPGEQRLYSVA